MNQNTQDSGAIILQPYHSPHGNNTGKSDLGRIRGLPAAPTDKGRYDVIGITENMLPVNLRYHMPKNFSENHQQLEHTPHPKRLPALWPKKFKEYRLQEVPNYWPAWCAHESRDGPGFKDERHKAPTITTCPTPAQVNPNYLDTSYTSLITILKLLPYVSSDYQGGTVPRSCP